MPALNIHVCKTGYGVDAVEAQKKSPANNQDCLKIPRPAAAIRRKAAKTLADCCMLSTRIPENAA